MTITESRLKSGELSFSPGTPPGTPTSFACQATNVRVTPSYDDDGDAVETLCGDSIPAGKKESWQLNGTSIQDFDDPAGFLTFCYTNRMTTVPFTWEPNQDGAPTWAGNVVILALEEGGDVNARLTTDFQFDLSGTPTRTYGTGLAAEQKPATVSGTQLVPPPEATEPAPEATEPEPESGTATPETGSGPAETPTT